MALHWKVNRIFKCHMFDQVIVQNPNKFTYALSLVRLLFQIQYSVALVLSCENTISEPHILSQAVLVSKSPFQTARHCQKQSVGLASASS